MDKKYQVFVSSTFIDLKEVRKKVIEILLMADCIPACMESFTATDAEQFDVIKKIIDLCDYYVLILGKRYGSISEATGISYTEMEYDYAVSKNIPVLVFALDNSTTNSPDKNDANTTDTEKSGTDKTETEKTDTKKTEAQKTDTENPDFKKTDVDTSYRARYEAFRAKALDNRMSSICYSIDDLACKFAVAIMKAKYEIRRPGWQRVTGIDEVSCRRQIMDLQRTLDLLTENQRLHEDLKELKNREKELPEKRRYAEYEGKWIQYILDSPRTYAVCELLYRDGCYQFNGINFYPDEKEPIYFESKVVNQHMMTKDDYKSFCYITDASEVGKIVHRLHGFGEAEFHDLKQTGAHDGHGYFYDVESALGKTNDKALMEYKMVKHDEYLYRRLGIEKTIDEIEKMDFRAICNLANQHGEACFARLK